MDFGAVGLDTFLSSNNGGSFALENASSEANNNNNNKQKWSGFGFLKQERAINEDEFRDLKVARTLQRSNSSNLSDGGGHRHQQMLSFSSPTLPYYHHTTTSTPFCRNTGYGSAGINAASMQGVLSGVKGPFTPSQWMELEHQALIYKYITANVPIPSYLLNPIRKAFESVGFSSFSGLRSNALGWGAFHLGFSNTDPEPGRCRRTDGKKWRCSRDAVAEQKYCERHMNRGRHRSRKPVEGQPGHSASSGPTTTTTNGKLTATSAATVGPAVGASNNGLGLSHHHRELSGLLQPGSNNHLSGLMPSVNRSLLDKENADETYQQHTPLVSVSPKATLKDNNNQYSHPKHHNAYEESEFGLVCSDSLLNPLHSHSSLMTNCRNSYGGGASDNSLNNHENKSSPHHPLRQFIDNWPENQTQQQQHQQSAVSDRTQLSISIPNMATSDFMSSTSSPTNENLEMGLGVGPFAIEQRNQRQQVNNNWVPISWEPSSLGGPLGEVLHTNMGECKNNAKPLNLIDSWQNNSPRLASSPTGVLQRGPFVSLSNSSAGSSPRAESSRVLDGVGLCSGIIANPSLPAP